MRKLFLCYGPNGAALVSAPRHNIARKIAHDWLDWPDCAVTHADGMQHYFTDFGGTDDLPVIFSPDDGETWELVTERRAMEPA